MSASVSLSWVALSVNGRETNNLPVTAISCGWSHSKCELHISATSSIDILLQVELEVMDLTYCYPENNNNKAIMIITVMINKPCALTGHSMKTWYGKIGVEFNTKPGTATWSLANYKRFLACLASCYDPKDIHRLRISQMEELWSKISEPPVLPVQSKKMVIFKDLKYGDLDGLQPGKWLNDSLVSSGLKYWILVRYSDPDHPTHVLETFFLRLFKDHGMDRVQRWMKCDKFFSLSHLLIPIHVDDNHWILAIIFIPKGCLESDDNPILVTILDSLHLQAKYDEVSALLCEWVQFICAQKSSRKPKIVPLKAKVPLQPNYCDCGVYVLHFAKVFLSDPVSFTNFFQEPPVDSNLQEIWHMDKFSSVRMEYLSYIISVELPLQQ